MAEIKRIPVKLKLYEFLVTFSYETVKTKKYREQQHKVYGINKDNAENNFIRWKREQRTMFNAKILGIAKTDAEPKIIEV